MPDYLDEDSDGDTIPDTAEAGDVDLDTPPVDSDADGTQDYLDIDSDANGILDRDEGVEDRDGDTIGDHADPDNDGDDIDDVDEIGGVPSAPVDTDGDGVPDLHDLDSDDDTITDHQERPAESDVDEDLVPDRLDLDTDGDTIPDASEAGDEDPHTWPRDTDVDGTADFRDLDSDNDGLSDAWENENGCDPYAADTDGDGMSDLIEVGTGTDCRDSYSPPPHRENYVFIMYHNDPTSPYWTGPVDPDPTMDHLVFNTDLQKADVFLALGANSTMDEEIDNLMASFRSTVVPGVLAEIPNTWFGTGWFRDCDSMAVTQVMTDDPTATEASLVGWTTGSWPPPSTHFLHALATGDLSPYSSWSGVTPTTCTPPGSVGWPCFRPDALPIVVQVGDAPFSDAISGCSPSVEHGAAIAALSSIKARYIGINSGSSRADMVAITEGTGSLDLSGTPLVFDISSSGTGLGAQVVEAIEILAEQVPVQVTVQLRDDPSDLVDTVEEFVDSVLPDTTGGWPDPADPTIICVGGLSTADLEEPFDGAHDGFALVLPGTPVCFDIRVKQNCTVPATDEPQTFLLEIDVVAEGLTVLDTRQVYFLVPPVFIGAP